MIFVVLWFRFAFRVCSCLMLVREAAKRPSEPVLSLSKVARPHLDWRPCASKKLQLLQQNLQLVTATPSIILYCKLLPVRTSLGLLQASALLYINPKHRGHTVPQVIMKRPGSASHAPQFRGRDHYAGACNSRQT